MTRYEYLVVPAPRRGLKDKSIKGVEARFAAAMSALMNHHAADGWEYLRTDTLPSDEREGLSMTRVTVFQNMMVFRRLATLDDTAETVLIEDHSDDQSVPADAPAPHDQPPETTPDGAVDRP